MAHNENQEGAVGGNVTPPQVHHHHHSHYNNYRIFLGGNIVFGNVTGDVVQTTATEISSTNIESVQVNQPQSQEPHTQHQVSNADLASVLSTLMRTLGLPEDLRQQTEAALRNNDQQTFHPQEQSEEAAPDSSAAITGGQFPTDDVINQLKKMKLDENVETLMKGGFEALIRDDETEKSTMDFIQAYVDEGNEIPADAKENFKELDPLLEQVWNDIYLKIAIATCERHLEDNSGLRCALAKICLFLAKQMKEQKKEQVLSSFSNKIKEASKVREPLYGKTKPVRAIILSYAAAKLHQIDNKGKHSLIGILDCVDVSITILFQMGETRKLSQFHKDHVIPLVLEIIGCRKTTTGLSKERRVMSEAWCLDYSGYCWYLHGDYDQAAEQLKSAIDLMERELKEKAPTFRVYGVCLCNYADIHREKGDIDGLRKATDFYNKSIQAWAKARNWASVQEKDNLIESIKRELKRCKEKLQQRLESE